VVKGVKSLPQVASSKILSSPLVANINRMPTL
jgi:hypothetical protein